MKILIVSATHLEIEPLVRKLKLRKQLTANLIRYTYKQYVIDILISGVGMVSTAFNLGTILSRRRYDAAINMGIAGSFNPELKIGDVVNITSDRFSEMGAESGEKFLSFIDLKLIEKDDFPYTDNMLINDSQIRSLVLQKLPKACGITVNTMLGKTETIERVKHLFHPDVESMEGAAFFYACLCLKMRCFQIRAISNFVEKRNKEKWNIPLAVANVNRILLEILDE
ncbi:MAG TPA: futalosine hydrolase, partial [Bacteroidales bacterium]|nr:futalosine hydrolase [Bacteroidales bacterium]